MLPGCKCMLITKFACSDHASATKTVTPAWAALDLDNYAFFPPRPPLYRAWSAALLGASKPGFRPEISLSATASRATTGRPSGRQM